MTDATAALEVATLSDELRREVECWLDVVRSGEQIVLTDGGVPVARINSAVEESLLRRLHSEGALSLPDVRRPSSTEMRRTRPTGSAADLLIAERDALR